MYSSEPFVEIDRYCIDIAKIFGKEKRKERKERKVMEHDIHLEYQEFEYERDELVHH